MNITNILRAGAVIEMGVSVVADVATEGTRHLNMGAIIGMCGSNHGLGTYGRGLWPKSSQRHLLFTSVDTVFRKSCSTDSSEPLKKHLMKV